MVQLADSKETSVTTVEQNRVKGFIAAVVSCVLSGLAGIYFEKILKGNLLTKKPSNTKIELHLLVESAVEK